MLILDVPPTKFMNLLFRMNGMSESDGNMEVS